ncbi:MAG: flagellar hook-associated protein FlgL [Pseudomonadota bacterium]
MRISTAQFYAQGVSSLTEMQSRLARTQMQLASGNRLLSPSDDPVAAARLLDINSAVEQNDQYQRNINMARNRLGLEEQVLSDIESVLFRIRDLAIQANNDTLDSSTRGYIAAESAEALDQLVQLGNTRDAQGNFIFAGFSSDSRPFAQTAAGIRYDGDQGQRQIQIGDTRTVADGDSGDSIFMSIPNGTGTFAVSANATNSGTGVLGARALADVALWDNDTYTIEFTAADAYTVTDSGGSTVAIGSYTSGDSISVQGVELVLSGAPEVGDSFDVGPSTSQDMFTTIQNFIDALDSPTNPTGIAQLHNQVGNTIEDLDRSVDNLLEFRTRVGSRLQSIDAQEASNEDFAITLETTRAELQELDYAEAVTRLSQQLVGLEAAQRSFAQIQGLSLFRFI